VVRVWCAASISVRVSVLMMPMEICKYRYSSSFRRDEDVSKLQYDFTQKPLPTRQAAPSLPRRRRPRRGAALHPPPPRASRAHASSPSCDTLVLLCAPMGRCATPVCCVVRPGGGERTPLRFAFSPSRRAHTCCAPTARRVGRRRQLRTYSALLRAALAQRCRRAGLSRINSELRRRRARCCEAHRTARV
jgi:hypothetical protein